MSDTRIDKRYAALKAEGRAALVTFLMAGDPDEATALAIVKALPAAGADVIELGMPFTDPMADGPAIQLSSQRALKSGQTMTRTLAMVRACRSSRMPFTNCPRGGARRCRGPCRRGRRD